MDGIFYSRESNWWTPSRWWATLGRRPLHSGARTRSTPLNSPTKKWQEKSLGTSAASTLWLQGQHCPPHRAQTTAQESPAPPEGRTGPHTHSRWPVGEGDGQTSRCLLEPEDLSVATTPGEAAEATNHISKHVWPALPSAHIVTILYMYL